MKIEVGKFYRTADGRKARIYSDDNCGVYGNLIHGAIFTLGNWMLECWNPDGSSFQEGFKSSATIVEEWLEPKEVCDKSCKNLRTLTNEHIDGAIYKFEAFAASVSAYHRATSWLIQQKHMVVFREALLQLKYANGEVTDEQWCNRLKLEDQCRS